MGGAVVVCVITVAHLREGAIMRVKSCETMNSMSEQIPCWRVRESRETFWSSASSCSLWVMVAHIGIDCSTWDACALGSGTNLSFELHFICWDLGKRNSLPVASGTPRPR